MTQKEKELLIKDLCGRLPYKVKVTTTNAAVKFGVISGISIENKISVRTKHADIIFDCTEVKPYMFPLSSMTEEQKKEYLSLCEEIPIYDNYYGKYEICDTYYVDTKFSIDWLNKNHFDYRGLIPMGLAIDCTNLNIY